MHPLHGTGEESQTLVGLQESKEGAGVLGRQPAWVEPSEKKTICGFFFSHLLTYLSLVVHGYQFSDV